jgi:hypothetical protein
MAELSIPIHGFVYRSSGGKMFYKLTESELTELSNRGLVSSNSLSEILTAAKERKPREFAEKVFACALNQAGTIKVQNVHYYGGEHFNEPYAFIAEIVPKTTNSAWSAFANRKLRGIPLRAFTY